MPYFFITRIGSSCQFRTGPPILAIYRLPWLDCAVCVFLIPWDERCDRWWPSGWWLH